MRTSEVYLDFVKWGSAKYAKGTIKAYGKYIQNFIDYACDPRLEKIDITTINDYHDYLSHRLKPATIALYLIALRQFFRYLHFRELINWNYQIIPIPKFSHESHRPSQDWQVDYMLDHIKGETIQARRDRAIVAFLYSSGCRVSEVASLRWSDINLENKTGTITSQKTRATRMIFFDDRTKGLLLEMSCDRIYDDYSDFIFTIVHSRIKGMKASTRAIQRVIEKYRPDKWLKAHSFRHGLGVRALKNGVNIRYIQKILGHKSLSSTQVYLNITDNDILEVYQSKLN